MSMKAVILAGGFGTRISEETSIRPKPMVEIGGRPILWHIMKLYSHFGIHDFIVCCGYRGEVIKRYFAEYFLAHSDITYDLARGETETHRSVSEPWRVTCVDTGLDTMTGGRLRRIRHYLDPEEPFCLTYGDGVANLDVRKSIKFHREHGKLATLTAVQPMGRFGAFALNQGETSVSSFLEKPRGDGAWVNGGFFVLSPQVMDYIEGDDCVWERGPLEQLAGDGELEAYRHHGFWQAMDTLRDKMVLEELWKEKKAPWKVWSPERPAFVSPSPSPSSTDTLTLDRKVV
jgi:glucose-1-phosphate cytidylyltransferase